MIARGEDDVKKAAEALNELNCPGKAPDAQVYGLAGDIGSAENCQRLADEVSKTTNHVNIFIANAGATYIGQFDDTTEEGFANVMHVNVNSVFFSIQK